jgi:hypothetical protein
MKTTPITTETSNPKSWFECRPIPVFIITALCVLQFLGIMLYISEHWSELVDLVRRGAESPLAFVWKLVYPFLLLTAGLTLLTLRKVAILFFGAYLAWGIGKIIVHTIDFPGYLSLALVFGVLVYCLRLVKQGILR